MDNTTDARRALLIGGNLICGTLINRKLLSGIEVADSLIGCSPFSLASATPRAIEAAYGQAETVDLTNGLEQYLQEHPADMLVLDLHYVCRAIVAVGTDYFTKFPNIAPHDYGANCVPVKVAALKQEEKKKLVLAFAEILLKFFPGERIALIQTYKSEYYAVMSRIRKQEAESLNQYVGECEGWFQEYTGCRVIQTLQYYFMEKKADGMQYEQEAYLDLADNVKRFVRGDHVRMRPIFRYSLDRYCKYYDNVYKAAFGQFLRTSNAVENLVYSSEPQFVQDNRELLCAAEKLLLRGYRDVAEKLNLSMPNAQTLRDLLRAMDAVMRKEYDNPEIHYHLLFENRITVRELLKDVKKFVEQHVDGIYPEQVTEVNYGYYFSMMQLQKTTDQTLLAQATATMQMLQADPSVTLTPELLDLWGSCVSRLNFQYDNIAHRYRFVYRSNMFQGMPLFLDQPAVSYPPLLFKPPISFDNKMVQIQLDNQIRDILDQSGARWLIADFYTLTALTVHDYKGKIFCDNQGVFYKKLKAGNVTLHKKFSQEEIFAELDKLADYVNQRYEGRVILIKHKRMEHYIDFEGKICTFPSKELADSVERNLYNECYTDYFVNRSGCYYIDLIDQFLSDEMNILYLKSVHYEDAFYEEVQKLMLHILTQEPTQRHFTTYDHGTRVRRIARMTQKNAGNPVLKKLFGGGWLDECLLQTNPEIVLENAEIFARMYDEHYSSAEEALNRCNFAGCEPAKMALSAWIAKE